MNRVVLALSAIVGRAPWAVIATTVLLTLILAGFASQVEVSPGGEGFAPDNAEIAAAETLGDRFGASGEEAVQFLVTGPDVISADGLAAVTAVADAIAGSDAAGVLAQREQRPAVVSWLGGVQQALGDGGAGVELTDADIDEIFADSLAQLSPEQQGFITNLLPDDADIVGARADVGMVVVFLSTEGLPEETGAYWDALIELERGLVAAVQTADLPDGYGVEAFAFPLLFGDDDAFNAELTRLFSTAFLIILAILAMVYWLRPGGGGGSNPRSDRLGMTLVGAGRRTVADVLLTMATIVMAIMWMSGLAALLGPGYLGLIGAMTEISQIVPVLLIGLGVDYAIHLSARYREEVGAGADVVTAIRLAVRTVGLALVLATVTTAVGFLTNVFNPVPALRDFGVLAAAGIISAFLLMLTFVPALRLVLDRRAERTGRLPRQALARTSERLLPEFMARTAVLAERVPVATLLVTVVLGGALGAWGLASLETRFSSTDFVAEGSPILDTLDALQTRFRGGVGEQTQLLVGGAVADGTDGGAVATPAVHNALVDGLGALADVGDVVTLGERIQAESVVGLLGHLLSPAPDGQPLAPAVADAAAAAGVGPDLKVAADADVAALYRALLETAPGDAARVIAVGDDGQPELLRLALQTTAGEERAGDLVVALDAAFAQVEEAGSGVVATSNPIINDVIVKALQDSQLSSMAITLLAAMLLLVVTFWVRNRRPLLGVLTTAPVILVVLWTFGMMAATGVPFGPITATMAALAIGIGIPYSIHITNRYLEDREDCPDPEAAVRSTVRHTGGALAGSALTTCAGFGILTTSSLVPFRQFGLVTVYAIGFALLAATIVLPSMLALWDRWHHRRTAPELPAAMETSSAGA